MKIKTTLAASALVLAFGLAMPAAAQQTSDNQAGPTTGGVGVGNTATSTATSTDLNVQDSGNDNSDNSVNDSGNLDIADSGNDNSDNSINDSGNTDIDDSGNTDNSVNDSGNLAFALASFNTDNSNNSTNDSNNGNDSSSVVATQVLTATVANAAPLNFFSIASDYSSGDNTVNGSAFAAFSGILNQGWNTGINANAQAATNVAARGTVTFSQ